MGVQNSGRHKRTKSGGKKGIHCKKRAHALARPPAHTKIGINKVKALRTRGGNEKARALRLEAGNFVLKSHNIANPHKISAVMFHPSSTELFRANTLTKGCVVKLDMGGLKDRLDLSFFKANDPLFLDQIEKNNLFGVVTTRPGQVGKADGRILQGNELEFYMARFKKGKAK